MKILVAPDKFKGISTAQGVADTLSKLIQKQQQLQKKIILII